MLYDGSSVTDWKYYPAENSLAASSRISWDVVRVSFVFIIVTVDGETNPGNHFQTWEGQESD